MRRSIFLSALFVSFSFLAVAQSLKGPGPDAWMNVITGNAVTKTTTGSFPKAPAGCALYFTQSGDIRAPYLVYVPAGYNPAKPSKLVVFLHGAILAKDSFQYKNPAIASEPIFSVADTFNTLIIFPFARTDFKWSGQSAAYENIISILRQVETNYNVDKSKIYIGGISMGGIAAFWFINHNPSVFAGFYSFSGVPHVDNEEIMFRNITASKPLYMVNAKDDAVFKYNEVEAIYLQHKNEAPGWHFSSVETGGHRFIYKDGGRQIKALLSNLLK